MFLLLLVVLAAVIRAQCDRVELVLEEVVSKLMRNVGAPPLDNMRVVLDDDSGATHGQERGRPRLWPRDVEVRVGLVAQSMLEKSGERVDGDAVSLGKLVGVEAVVVAKAELGAFLYGDLTDRGLSPPEPRLGLTAVRPGIAVQLLR